VNPQNARQIESTLPDDALVIDVGGGGAAFARADWVIDALAFEQRGRLLKAGDAERPNRFTRDSWVQFDLCSRERWPFEDEQFDYAVCSHVLEDLRDPIWVCAEISRISKAGYIEVPSRVVEQSTGIEHPRLAGYHHHRWLISKCNDLLEFRMKPHLLHVTRDAIVAKTGPWRAINPRHEITVHYWEGAIPCREVLEFDEREVVRELCEFSRHARTLPELVVKPNLPLAARLRRAVYFFRLARGLG
jgi:hypothetical protein